MKMIVRATAVLGFRLVTTGLVKETEVTKDKRKNRDHPAVKIASDGKVPLLNIWVVRNSPSLPLHPDPF